MTLHCTMTYYGREADSQGIPKPWHHYLVVADSRGASIISLSEIRATGAAQKESHAVSAEDGGAEAALAMAEKYLDEQHPGLRKWISQVHTTK